MKKSWHILFLLLFPSKIIRANCDVIMEHGNNTRRPKQQDEGRTTTAMLTMRLSMHNAQTLEWTPLHNTQSTCRYNISSPKSTVLSCRFRRSPYHPLVRAIPVFPRWNLKEFVFVFSDVTLTFKPETMWGGGYNS